MILAAIAVCSARLSEVEKTLRPQREERKTQKSSLISKEEVNKRRQHLGTMNPNAPNAMIAKLK